MIISLSKATPQDLPAPLPADGRAGGTPQTWFNSQLVQVTTDAGAKKAWAVPAWSNGVAYVPGTNMVVKSEMAMRNQHAHHAIAKVAATDLLGAVKAAHSETLRSTNSAGVADWNATAVLQGVDGAYYIAPLGYFSGSRLKGVYIDGPNLRGELTDVSRLQDCVQAVVGKSSWVNFTSTKLDVDLSS